MKMHARHPATGWIWEVREEEKEGSPRAPPRLRTREYGKSEDFRLSPGYPPAI